MRLLAALLVLPLLACSGDGSGDAVPACGPFTPALLSPYVEANQCEDGCTVASLGGPGSSFCESHWLLLHNDASNEDMVVCSTVPNLAWAVVPGDEVSVSWKSISNDNDAPDVTLTVTKGDQLVLFEAHTVLHAIPYPDNVTVTVLEPMCEVPPKAGYLECKGLYHHPAEVLIDGEAATLEPGQTQAVGSYQVLLGRLQRPSPSKLPDTQCSSDPYSASATDIAIYRNPL